MVCRAHAGGIVTGVALVAVGFLVACGGAASPSSPAPAPSATPVPVPTPTPDPNVPPVGSGCGKPYPPPITRLKVKVLYKGAEFWTVDSTPLVGPDQTYCLSVGFTDGRSAAAPCDHHEAGPFTVKAFKGGTYRVCTEAGACAEVFADRNL